MEVYRICLAEYANDLFASGFRGRWNVKGSFVIYTAGSRALACLENVVHRSGEGLQSIFKVLVIHVPEGLPREQIKTSQLPADWHKTRNYPLCQPIGEAWYHRGASAILEVPSSIVPNESNFILNTRHPDFKSIRIIRREDFNFDPRIKANDPKAF
ncbi:MAG: RES family NAD+ phosphorylase [Adhaeribacter sp.]